MPRIDDLIQLQTEQDTAIERADAVAANGAPMREPEVWDDRIAEFNPLFGHQPEPMPIAVSPGLAATAKTGEFRVRDYLADERRKDLLRFSTAGSVDDGKSTLIGRLLYDTQSVYDDQVRSIEGKGTTAPGVLDLALLTDGLRAEREQGITIDVAYRYFSTARRKFIIADTPGHEQYTRNMATGASTASLAIVLVDARKGVLVQSRRHACLAALLGVRHLVVAVNKMDLAAYDEAAFRTIEADFNAFFADLRQTFGSLEADVRFVPVSALAGDNVVHRSSAMPWYTGPALLDLLESVPADEASVEAPFRLAVQRVLRPNGDFRGFAGQVASGAVHPGDEVMVLPSGRRGRVRSIVTFGGDLAEAHAPRSITLTLEDELDISRGDLLVSPTSPATLTRRLRASLVWMHEQPLDLGRRYLLKHTSRTVQAQVTAVEHRLDVATLTREPASTLALNAIGTVALETVQPIAVDLYNANRTTGSFVLIDPATNATVAAGMIRGAETGDAETGETGARLASGLATGPVTAAERLTRWGHAGFQLALAAPAEFADAVERSLFERGAMVLRVADEDTPAIRTMLSAGALVLTHSPADTPAMTVGGQRIAVERPEDVIRELQRKNLWNGDDTL